MATFISIFCAPKFLRAEKCDTAAIQVSFQIDLSNNNVKNEFNYNKLS